VFFFCFSFLIFHLLLFISAVLQVFPTGMTEVSANTVLKTALTTLEKLFGFPTGSATSNHSAGPVEFFESGGLEVLVELTFSMEEGSEQLEALTLLAKIFPALLEASQNSEVSGTLPEREIRKLWFEVASRAVSFLVNRLEKRVESDVRLTGRETTPQTHMAFLSTAFVLVHMMSDCVQRGRGLDFLDSCPCFLRDVYRLLEGLCFFLGRVSGRPGFPLRTLQVMMGLTSFVINFLIRLLRSDILVQTADHSSGNNNAFALTPDSRTVRQRKHSELQRALLLFSEGPEGPRLGKDIVALVVQYALFGNGGLQRWTDLLSRAAFVLSRAADVLGPVAYAGSFHPVPMCPGVQDCFRILAHLNFDFSVPSDRSCHIAIQLEDGILRFVLNTLRKFCDSAKDMEGAERSTAELLRFVRGSGVVLVLDFLKCVIEGSVQETYRLFLAGLLDCLSSVADKVVALYQSLLNAPGGGFNSKEDVRNSGSFYFLVETVMEGVLTCAVPLLSFAGKTDALRVFNHDFLNIIFCALESPHRADLLATFCSVAQQVAGFLVRMSEPPAVVLPLTLRNRLVKYVLRTLWYVVRDFAAPDHYTFTGKPWNWDWHNMNMVHQYVQRAWTLLSRTAAMDEGVRDELNRMATFWLKSLSYKEFNKGSARRNGKNVRTLLSELVESWQV